LTCADRRRLHWLRADKRQGKNPPRSGIHGLVSAQISIDEALTGTDQIRQVRTSASGVHWLASIATEDNRTTIRRFHAGGTTDLTPEANVRSRVMEYGGGAYDVAEDLVVWVDDTTKRLWLLEGEARRPLT